MDRRSFCKMAALAAGAIGLGGARAFATTGAVRNPVNAKVTVIRRACFEDLQSLFLEDPECGPCEAFETGETFMTTGVCPEGFCPKAWETIAGCIDRASHCPESNGYEGAVIAACPDGTRPVIFRIEL